MTDLETLLQAVNKGNRAEAKRLTQAMLDADVEPQVILEQGLVAGMKEVGERFKRNDAFVPELLLAARAMKESLALLEPMLKAGGDAGTAQKPKITAVIGTVQGDLHDIGKNLVATMWRGANIAVIDVGVNATAEQFIAAATEHHAQIVGLSALLTTTMPAMKQTVAALRSASLPGVKVVVGGAPITRDFATEIGADGFAGDAASAVDVVMNLTAGAAVAAA
jgi:5-methyltetrahydrofolate--homocysteine methyltransferase